METIQTIEIFLSPGVLMFIGVLFNKRKVGVM